MFFICGKHQDQWLQWIAGTVFAAGSKSEAWLGLNGVTGLLLAQMAQPLRQRLVSSNVFDPH